MKKFKVLNLAVLTLGFAFMAMQSPVSAMFPGGQAPKRMKLEDGYYAANNEQTFDVLNSYTEEHMIGVLNGLITMRDTVSNLPEAAYYRFVNAGLNAESFMDGNVYILLEILNSVRASKEEENALKQVIGNLRINLIELYEFEVGLFRDSFNKLENAYKKRIALRVVETMIRGETTNLYFEDKLLEIISNNYKKISVKPLEEIDDATGNCMSELVIELDKLNPISEKIIIEVAGRYYFEGEKDGECVLAFRF